jgi:hypothetical protein
MNGIEKIAEQVDMHYRRFEDEFCKADTDGIPREMLEAFAKLVAAKEREACAKTVEQCAWPKSAEHPYDTRDVFASAIRART